MSIMAAAQLVNCATDQLRKEENMGQTMAKRTRKMTCPSCGASIHFRHDKNSIGMCPECGDWLIQRSWLGRKLELVDEEMPSSAFEETDEFERALMDEIE